MDLISRETLRRKVQKVAVEAWKLKMTASVEAVMNQFLDFLEQAPSVPDVPLDKLCKMLSKSNVNVPCNDDCEGCEAFDGTGDTVNCWKVTLIKWMEEQDADNI